MNYSLPISMMRWSYSRLCAFEDCKYKFLLNYIYSEEQKSKFFAEYGTLVHGVAEQFLTGEITRSEAINEFLVGFTSITPRAPNNTIYSNYFNQGIEYFKTTQPISGKINTEQEIEFNIGGYEFIGYIDLLIKDKENPGYSIQDIKTRILKGKNTVDFNKYIRQLYLYSIGTHKKFGEYPRELQINCFRNGTIISEEFDEEKLRETKQWALDTIHAIEKETEWEPTINWFYCKYICGLSHVCEYADLL